MKEWRQQKNIEEEQGDEEGNNNNEKNANQYARKSAILKTTQNGIEYNKDML